MFKRVVNLVVLYVFALSSIVSGCASVPGEKSSNSDDSEDDSEIVVQLEESPAMTKNQRNQWDHCIAEVNNDPEKYGYNPGFTPVPKILSISQYEHLQQEPSAGENAATEAKKMGIYVGAAVTAMVAAPLFLIGGAAAAPALIKKRDQQKEYVRKLTAATNSASLAVHTCFTPALQSKEVMEIMQKQQGMMLKQ